MCTIIQFSISIILGDGLTRSFSNIIRNFEITTTRYTFSPVTALPNRPWLNRPVWTTSTVTGTVVHWQFFSLSCPKTRPEPLKPCRGGTSVYTDHSKRKKQKKKKYLILGTLIIGIAFHDVLEITTNRPWEPQICNARVSLRRRKKIFGYYTRTHTPIHHIRKNHERAKRKQEDT